MADHRPRLLLLHEDVDLLQRMASALGRLGEAIAPAGTSEALEILAAGHVDLVVLGWPSAGLFEQVRIHRDLPVIGIAAPGAGHDTVDRVSALQAGLHDLLGSPPDLRELELVAGRCLAVRRLQREVARLRDEMAQRDDLNQLIGISPAMQEARHALRQAAATDVPVLLVGESGTGRAWAARALHSGGRRRLAPFVSLDVSAFSPAVVEAELFGAEGIRSGRIASAEAGTLFLSEVHALPPALQARLLWALAVQVEPAGSSRGHRPDVRLVCSTGQDLEPMVEEGRFLRDLHGLVSAVTVRLPPLRERPEDIPVLAAAFLDRLCRQNHAVRRVFSPDALEALAAHPWKGNARELRHVIECLVLQPGGEKVTRRDLPRALQTSAPPSTEILARIPDGGVQLDQQMAGYERALLLSALERTAGRKKEAALLLGINKDQMKYLCRKHGL